MSDFDSWELIDRPNALLRCTAPRLRMLCSVPLWAFNRCHRSCSSRLYDGRDDLCTCSGVVKRTQLCRRRWSLDAVECGTQQGGRACPLARGSARAERLEAEARWKRSLVRRCRRAIGVLQATAASRSCFCHCSPFFIAKKPSKRMMIVAASFKCPPLPLRPSMAPDQVRSALCEGVTSATSSGALQPITGRAAA